MNTAVVRDVHGHAHSRVWSPMRLFCTTSRTVVSALLAPLRHDGGRP